MEEGAKTGDGKINQGLPGILSEFKVSLGNLSKIYFKIKVTKRVEDIFQCEDPCPMQLSVYQMEKGKEEGKRRGENKRRKKMRKGKVKEERKGRRKKGATRDNPI